MAPLRFCANISWLFTELPNFSQRIYAAASAGFQAVEAAWLYESDLQELQRAREATGVEVVLINTPPGDVNAGDLGLGAVPGREAEFRQGLDLALTYARALGCKRIHLMAGRVPVDSNRRAVAEEMEAIFVQNLVYAANILSKSFHNESIVDSDDEDTPERSTSSRQRTTGGQPAVSEEVEAEAVDLGGRQVKEQMFIRRVEDIAHEQARIQGLHLEQSHQVLELCLTPLFVVLYLLFVLHFL